MSSSPRIPPDTTRFARKDLDAYLLESKFRTKAVDDERIFRLGLIKPILSRSRLNSFKLAEHFELSTVKELEEMQTVDEALNSNGERGRIVNALKRGGFGFIDPIRRLAEFVNYDARQFDVVLKSFGVRNLGSGSIEILISEFQK